MMMREELESFSMLNLAQYRRTSFIALNIGVFTFLAAVSAFAGKGFLHSEGYLGSMRAGIWQEKPLLALLVEWPGSTPEFWSEASSIVADNLLFNFDFRKPWVGL